jgi:hypothetical protein
MSVILPWLGVHPSPVLKRHVAFLAAREASAADPGPSRGRACHPTGGRYAGSGAGRPAATLCSTTIQRHVRAIEGDGYTIVEDAIDFDLISALRAICCASSTPATSGRPAMFEGAHGTNLQSPPTVPSARIPIHDRADRGARPIAAA